MKIRKGRIILDRNDTRVGSFVLTVLSDRVKAQDIHGNVSFSVSRSVPKGMLLESMAKDGADGLRGLLAVTWNFLSVVPDMELLGDVNRLCAECAGRHPEMYGAAPAATEGDHAEALEDARRDEEAREAFANAPGGGEDGR